jgi:hypothetical protein
VGVVQEEMSMATSKAVRYFHDPRSRVVYAVAPSLWSDRHEKWTRRNPHPALISRHVGTRFDSMSATIGRGHGHMQDAYLAPRYSAEMARDLWEGGHMQAKIGGPGLVEITAEQHATLRDEYERAFAAKRDGK